MDEIDEADIKAEIDEISKKIDAIVQNIEKLDPASQNADDSKP
jgi:hypothetical protein